MEKPAQVREKQGGKEQLRHPWLVAAWPGMGSVAALAAGHLAQSLPAEPLAMIPEREFFSIDHVDVRHGIARSGRLPRNMFFGWRDPQARRDVLIFLGEAQPGAKGYALCHRILDFAIERGIERVVTFAAMATNLHPSGEPRVFGAVTAPDLLKELREHGVQLLEEGAISGLNGSLLAAAAERGVPSMCLLGELPYFGAAVPNPKASLAVLRAFAGMAGLSLDLESLERQSAEAEPQLLELLEQLGDQARTGSIGEADAPQPTGGVEPVRPALDEETSARVERLFDEAANDRQHVPRLKAELDRLGVFARYEDRFLDLFRREA